MDSGVDTSQQFLETCFVLTLSATGVACAPDGAAHRRRRPFGLAKCQSTSSPFSSKGTRAGPNKTDFPGIRGGLPHSEIHGSKLIRSSPRLFAAYHVLLRLCMPRHPPNALTTLDRSHCQCSSFIGFGKPFLFACAQRGAKPGHPDKPDMPDPKSRLPFTTGTFTMPSTRSIRSLSRRCHAERHPGRIIKTSFSR